MKWILAVSILVLSTQAYAQDRIGVVYSDFDSSGVVDAADFDLFRSS